MHLYRILVNIGRVSKVSAPFCGGNVALALPAAAMALGIVAQGKGHGGNASTGTSCCHEAPHASLGPWLLHVATVMVPLMVPLHMPLAPEPASQLQ